MKYRTEKQLRAEVEFSSKREAEHQADMNATAQYVLPSPRHRAVFFISHDGARVLVPASTIEAAAAILGVKT